MCKRNGDNLCVPKEIDAMRIHFSVSFALVQPLFFVMGAIPLHRRDTPYTQVEAISLLVYFNKIPSLHNRLTLCCTVPPQSLSRWS